MTRVEELALREYPKMSRITEPHGIIPANNESHLIGDANKEKRKGYIKGYQQAEKDLALTWEDIELLNNLDRFILSKEPSLQLADKKIRFRKLAKAFNKQRKP